MLETPNYTSTVLQQYHTAISLLYYSFLAVMDPGPCIPTSVAVYDPAGSGPVKLSVIGQCVCNLPSCTAPSLSEPLPWIIC